mmetsp:Transcript_111506/g.167031  ORF Transcript_111506/g.167031 Transcript_111506/m.167031 type:complete len:255 (+) Transcript_111506:482-1246(+)
MHREEHRRDLEGLSVCVDLQHTELGVDAEREQIHGPANEGVDGRQRGVGNVDGAKLRDAAVSGGPNGNGDIVIGPCPLCATGCRWSELGVKAGDCTRWVVVQGKLGQSSGRPVNLDSSGVRQPGQSFATHSNDLVGRVRRLGKPEVKNAARSPTGDIRGQEGLHRASVEIDCHSGHALGDTGAEIEVGWVGRRSIEGGWVRNASIVGSKGVQESGAGQIDGKCRRPIPFAKHAKAAHVKRDACLGLQGRIQGLA